MYIKLTTMLSCYGIFFILQNATTCKWFFIVFKVCLLQQKRLMLSSLLFLFSSNISILAGSYPAALRSTSRLKFLVFILSIFIFDSQNTSWQHFNRNFAWFVRHEIAAGFYDPKSSLPQDALPSKAMSELKIAGPVATSDSRNCSPIDSLSLDTRNCRVALATSHHWVPVIAD